MLHQQRPTWETICGGVNTCARATITVPLDEYGKLIAELNKLSARSDVGGCVDLDAAAQLVASAHPAGCPRRLAGGA